VVHQSPDRALVAGWRGVRGPLGRWCGLFGYDRACRPARVAGEERAGCGEGRRLRRSRTVRASGRVRGVEVNQGRDLLGVSGRFASASTKRPRQKQQRNPQFLHGAKIAEAVDETHQIRVTGAARP